MSSFRKKWDRKNMSPGQFPHFHCTRLKGTRLSCTVTHRRPTNLETFSWRSHFLFMTRQVTVHVAQCDAMRRAHATVDRSRTHANKIPVQFSFSFVLTDRTMSHVNPSTCNMLSIAILRCNGIPKCTNDDKKKWSHEEHCNIKKVR